MSESEEIFTVIVATRGRPVEGLLDSLARQTTALEVVLVDQNEGPALDAAIDAYSQTIAIHHLHSAPGACRARNLGIARASGDILLFADDDAAYPAGTFEYVANRFRSDPGLGVLCGRYGERDGSLYVPHPKFPDREGYVTVRNMFQTASLAAMFFHRRRIPAAALTFREDLGPGAESGLVAGEEIELIFRLLRAGVRAIYDPSVAVIHPIKNSRMWEASIEEANSLVFAHVASESRDCWLRARVLLRTAKAMVMLASPRQRRRLWARARLKGLYRGLWGLAWTPPGHVN